MRDASWSYSSLEVYDRCPHKYRLRYVDKVKEPELPLANGKPEHANDRGTRIHTAIQDYIEGKTDVCPPDALPFMDNVNKLRALYALGFVSQEQDWGINTDWGIAEWRDAWGRMRVDGFVYEPGTTTALVIDYKTGKLFGNEVKHADQGSLYQAAAFARYPLLRSVSVEFWYIDQATITRKRYTRNTVGLTMERFNKRVQMINMDTVLRPKPDKFSCRYCGYALGICPYALKS